MNKTLTPENIIDWLSDLTESAELECKLAGGRDGKGALPKDFWETYSAFANTHGGLVVLGLREKPRGRFNIEGVQQTEKVITDLFNTLNNPSKVSANLLQDSDVEVLNVEGQSIIKISVPQASRKQKPVYLGSTPFNRNTFRRLHEGDRACDDEAVKRMLAEQVEDDRDSKLLTGFGWNDIDKQSLSVYRQMLKDTKPGHPFLDHDDFGLLKKLHGWRKDRQTGEEGLTLAGVLMFGTWDAIQEAAPHYFVDYQERPEAKTELRWVDRLVPDGTWSGNLFDFYRIVYRKLTNPDTLKVPFRLKSGQRRDDTPIHEAIREALVNTLVHADFSGRVSVLVVKRPDMLGFRNPGDMRIPLDRAVKGGESDCRNRIMHQMFLMIGLGERAGSGIPKIYSGWNWRHWRRPALYEIDEPPQTLLELRMLELMPEEIQQQLEDRFGESYRTLPRLERLILATAATEQVVSHGRISEITTDHSHDVTLALQSLVKQSMFETNGRGRGAVYHLPGAGIPTPEQVFGVPIGSDQDAVVDLSASDTSYSGDKAAYSGDKQSYSGDKQTYSGDKSFRVDNRVAFSGDSELATDHRDQFGRLISPALKAPAIHDLENLAPDFYARLKSVAEPSATSKRLDPETMRATILQLCVGHYVTRSCLAELLNRTADTLRHQYLGTMIDDKSLTLAFPQTPNDKRQAYITTSSLQEIQR
ncbi:Predicted transcriptional regulator, contains HTH domain [Marinobacter sp. LV10R510-11A]|uniref:RNA-binding domain-containing protein n=1 Tax=Marinobacter sp. LV10R510-11A TaxID=1415568 RepID=UPI000BB982C3|nr:RNA-binding domain-containing protein [Marinobacter sp. LV10R510-11A]SOB77863.1 Predicted transcriptional regulator, contains HTH domain [Marinobacter sp. LV10R510-11A]